MKKIELNIVTSIILNRMKKCQNYFQILPEALENNFNLPFKCNFRPQFSKPVLPNISSEKGGSADEILKKDSLEGLKEKFLKVFKIEENNLETDDKFLNIKID